MRVGKKVAASVAMLLSLVVGLAGCGGAKETKPTQSATAPAVGSSQQPKGPALPKQKVKWRHGIVLPKADTGFVFMTHLKGFDLKYNVEVEFVPMEGDTQILKALVAGEIDSMESSPTGPLNAIEQGAHLKIIGATYAKLSHVLYARTDIKTLKDLEGQPVAVSAPGSFPQVVTMALMKKAGADSSKVNWLVLGGDPRRIQGVIAGTVKAAVATEDYTAGLKPGDKVQVLSKADVELPDFVRNAVMTSDKVISEKPEALQAFMLAYAEGLRYAVKHREDFIDLTANEIKMEKSNPILGAAWDNAVNGKRISTSLEVSERGLTYMQELNIQMERQKAIMPMEKISDFRFQKVVAETLGAFQY